MDIVKENTGILPVEDKINEIQTLATDDLIIQESGFLEIFIDNDAQTPVYYDNLTVMHTPGRVLEVNTYYPYGMLIAELSTPALPGEWNGYKYSGKELQRELGLNWGDHGARMLDYTVGRWWTPDPLAELRPEWSPYRYGFCNPVNSTDPTGMLEGWYEDELKKLVFDATIKSQQDLTDAGIKGSYLGNSGIGIDEATGNTLSYNADGTTTDMGAQSISEVTVTGQWSGGSSLIPGGFFEGFGGFGTGMQDMGGSFRLSNGAYNGNALSIKHYESGWTGGSRARITTYNAAKWGGRISKGATGAGLAIGTGQIVYEMYQDDWNFGYNAQHKASEVAGGTIGTWGGAITGAKGGAAVGACFGGIGAPVGAIVGGIIGGIAGGWGGSEVGGATYRHLKKR